MMYDALLLALPFWAWACGQEGYASAWRRRSIGLVLALLFVEQHLVFFGAVAGPTRLGAYVWTWLAIELADLWADARGASRRGRGGRGMDTA